MRRSIIAWTALALVLPAVLLLLTSLPSGGSGTNEYRSALGLSLGFLGITLAFRRFWPKPGQVDRSSLVFMAVATLPFRLVAIGARWHIRWRLVAHVAWGTLLFVSLTSVVAALFGDSVTALGLALVACCFTMLGSLIVAMAASPADSRQQ